MSDWPRLDLNSLVNRRKRASVVRSYPKKEDSSSSGEWLCAHTYIPKSEERISQTCSRNDSPTYLSSVNKREICESISRKRSLSSRTTFSNASSFWNDEVLTQPASKVKEELSCSVKKRSSSSSLGHASTRKRSLSSLSEFSITREIGKNEVLTSPLPKIKHEKRSWSLKRNSRTSQSILPDVDVKNIINKCWSSPIFLKGSVVNEFSIKEENLRPLSFYEEKNEKQVKPEKVGSFDLQCSTKDASENLSLSVKTNVMETQLEVTRQPCSSDWSLPSNCVIKSPEPSLSVAYRSPIIEKKSLSQMSMNSHHENISIKSIRSRDMSTNSGRLVMIGTQTVEQVDIDMDETVDESPFEQVIIEDSQGLEIVSQETWLPQSLHSEQPLSPPKQVLNMKKKYTGLAGRLFSNMASLRSERAMAKRDPSIKSVTYNVQASSRGWGVTLLSLSSGDVVLSRLRTTRIPSVLTVALPLPKIVNPKYSPTIIDPIIIHHR